MTILLKVKEKAKTGEKTIKLTKFNVSDGNKTVSNEEGTVANIMIKNTKQEAIVKKAMILVMVILIFIAMLSILLVSLIRKNRKQGTSVEEIKEIDHTEETKEEQTTKEKEVKYDTQENMRKAIEGKDAKLEAIIIGEDGKEIEIRKERRKQERRKPERRQPDRRQEERRKTQTEEE